MAYFIIYEVINIPTLLLPLPTRCENVIFLFSALNYICSYDLLKKSKITWNFWLRDLYQSIIAFCARAGVSLQTQHSPPYPLLCLPFRIFIKSIYHNVAYHLDIFFCLELSSHLPYLLEHPSIGSSFIASGPANIFSSSLSVPALFFLLPLFLAQLHFLFCLSILHSPPYVGLYKEFTQIWFLDYLIVLFAG